jgi:uncharacterized protein
VTSLLLAGGHPLTVVSGIVIFAAGLGAGLFNGVAGGGTMLSFPTLLALGVPPITANVSSTVGILPGYLAAIVGYRRHVVANRSVISHLALPAFLGGVSGAVALLITPTAVFNGLVVVLIALATLLFAAQPVLAQRMRHHHASARHEVAAWFGVLAASLYGGYFGAGVGIVLLALFGLTLDLDLAQSSGVRSVLALLVNCIAAVIFVFHGAVNWAVVACLVPGSFLGGILGARLALSLPVRWLRAIVVAIGVVTTAVLALR